MKRAAQSELSNETLKRIALGGKLHGIDHGEYNRMVRAVERAMESGTDQPIVFDVRERNKKDSDDYELHLYPTNRENTLYLLQKLYSTRGAAHNNLTAALYDNEDEWRAYLEKEAKKTDDDDDDCDDDSSEDEEKNAAREARRALLYARYEANYKADQERKAVARHAWQDAALLECGVPPVGRITLEANGELSPWLYHHLCNYGLSEESSSDDDDC